MAETPKRSGFGLWIFVIIILWISSIAVAVLISTAANHKTILPRAPIAAPDLQAYSNDITRIAKSIEPAVVFIEVEQRVGGKATPDSPQQDIPDWAKPFFGPGSPFGGGGTPRSQSPSLEMGQGTGMVIDPAGYILTNNHVVANASRVRVHFASGDFYTATVLGTDRYTDLAVVKIDKRGNLPAVKLGDATDVEPGEWVMAVGFPFGERLAPVSFEPTVTTGVVSATHRQNQSEVEGRPFRDLIQTDAPINPGNSGGPLVNDRGEVIGINQSIFTSGLGGGNIGVGFAISINDRTRKIIDQLKNGKPVVRGQLGVSIIPLTPTLAENYRYRTTNGAFVNEVTPDSAAAKAGIKDQDIIIGFAGKHVNSPDELVNMVHDTAPGKKVKVDVWRDGKTETFVVTMGALEAGAQQTPLGRTSADMLGLKVQPLPAARAKQAGVNGGVLIASVDPLGAAMRAGIAVGDILTQINRTPVPNPETYNTVANSLKPSSAVVLRVWRGGHMYTLEIDKLAE
jgi:serine protease Do